MSDKTTIEWADASWNFLVGCSKVSAGCLPPCCVVAGNVLPGSAPLVEPVEGFAAATRADGRFVWLIRQTTASICQPIDESMVGDRRHDLQVLRSIVRLDPVDVVDLFTRPERSSDLLLGHDAMFVHVPTDIGGGMLGHFDQDVAVRGHGPSALPVRVALPGELPLSRCHADSVAQGCIPSRGY